MHAWERVAGRWSAAWWTAAVAMAIAAMALALRAPPARAGWVPVGERVMPQGVAVDHRTGIAYVGDADGSICRILAVNASGVPEVLAGGPGRCETSGDGGPAFNAAVEAPQRLAVDGSSNIYASTSATLRRISHSTGDIATWAGRAERNCLEFSYRGPVARVGAVAAEVDMHISGVASDPISGHLFVIDSCNRGIWEIDESDVLVARYGGIGTERWASHEVTFDPAGDLYFVEGTYGQQIVKMDRRGVFTTIAGNGGMSNNGDGGPATRAEFHEVTAVAVDSRSNLYFGTSDSYIRIVTPEGTMYAVAGRPWFESVPNPPYPGGPVEQGKFWSVNELSFDADDNLYVTDASDETLLTLTAPAESRSTVSWILYKKIQAVAGERTGGGNPSENDCDQGCYGDPVNTASGEYWERQLDMALPGRGPALSFERTYSAQATEESGPLGNGWSGSYLMSLEAEGPGGMVTIRQENGSTIAFEPNGSGGYLGPSAYLATLTANEGGGWTLTRRQRDRFVFDSAGRLVRELDLNGETTTLSYDEAGRLRTITDAGGQTIRLAYDGSNRIETLTDSAGRTVRYGYTSGDLTSVVDVRGQTWRYAYDEQHCLTRRIDPNGHLDVQNGYDSADRVTTQTDANEHVTRFAYGPGMTQVTSPGGHVRRDWYASGQLIQREDGVGTAAAGTWRYEYDSATHGTTKVVDPDGHTWRATYNAAGRRTSTTDPLEHTTRATYDSLGDMLTWVDGTNVTTTYTYDANGNLLTRSTPLTGTETSELTRYVHGDATHPGDITSIVDPRGKTTTFRFDGNGNPTSVADPLGDTTTMTYDADGNVRTVVSPRGNATGGSPEQHTTTYVHDAAGLLTQATDPLAHVTRWSYDAAGKLESVTDAKSHTTTYGYDGADLLTSIRRADETTLRRGYDADDNLTSRTDGAGKTTSYGYDARDRVTSVTDPLRRTTSFSYDAAGNRTRLVDPAERTTTYGYDNANRLTSITYSDGVTPNVSFGYDNANRRTSMRDGSGSSSYTWDSLGRLTQHADGLGSTVRYEYDLAGNVTRLTYPGTESVTRTYDNAGRLSTLTDWLGGVTRFGYDADSDLTRIVQPEASGDSDAYSFDNAGRMSSASFRQGTTQLASLTYTRDNNGLPTNEPQTGLPGSNMTGTYTALDQLASAQGSAYSYDAADNLTQMAGARPLAYDEANELREGPVPPGSSTVTATFGYDRDGNRTSATPAGGSATTYGYDQADRLVSFAAPSVERRTYAYDGDGLRVSKTVFSTVERFAWDHGSEELPLLLRDGANRYVYGPDGQALEQIDSAGTVTYLHHDAIGSTRVLTEARGAVSATFSYAPYGALTGSTGTARTPLGFAGEYTDSESGLQYLRARSYDPATGQFLSRDPIAGVTGQPYVYANGSPLAFTDPSGLSWIRDAGMFVSNAAAGALNELTLGLSNRIAGVDGSCAGAGYGFGARLGLAGSMFDGGEIRLGIGVERAAVRGVEHGGDTLGFDIVRRNYRSRTQPNFSVHLDMDPTRHGGPHFDIHRRKDAFGPKEKIRWPMDEPWTFPG
jgi:RHS repeat-associated protein